MATSYQPLLGTPKNTTTFSCRRVYLVLSLCAIILPTTFLGLHLIKTNRSDLSISSHLCDQAYDPKLCISMISELAASDGVRQFNGINLLQNFLMRSVPYTVSAIEVARSTKNRVSDHSHEQVALADCVELLNLSIDRVTDSVVALANWTTPSSSHANAAQAWLSSVLTNHVTCLDGLHILGRPFMETLLEDLISRARVSLAILARIVASDEEMVRPMNGELPSWITREDRKLLESLPDHHNIKANVVVAQDGSGDYRTVREAVASAPDKSKNRYVIYVKRGTYKENVEVGKKKKNVIIVGDGMDLTIITGSLNVVDGSTTFRSATLGNNSY
uniref:Pectinesterase n=1 Tax=Davidia involucrata TaxID=16924 RepID=A0A5B6YMU6_DAVIN